MVLFKILFFELSEILSMVSSKTSNEIPLISLSKSLFEISSMEPFKNLSL